MAAREWTLMNASGNLLARPREVMFRMSVGLVISVLCMLGCSDEGDDCDLIGAPQTPMFVVTVIDSVSGVPAWWGATGTIEDGAFREVLVPSSSEPADSVSEQTLFSRSLRGGVYTIMIEKSGYQTWMVSGLTVQRGGCALSSHFIDAQLQKIP